MTIVLMHSLSLVITRGLFITSRNKWKQEHSADSGGLESACIGLREMLAFRSSVHTVVRVVETLFIGILPCIFFLLRVPPCHIGRSKSATGGIFTPQTLDKVSNKGLLPGARAVKHFPE